MCDSGELFNCDAQWPVWGGWEMLVVAQFLVISTRDLHFTWHEENTWTIWINWEQHRLLIQASRWLSSHCHLASWRDWFLWCGGPSVCCSFFSPLYTLSGSLRVGGFFEARKLVLFNGYIYSTTFYIISSVPSLHFILKPCFAPKEASKSKQTENRKVTKFLCNLLCLLS